LENQRWKYVGRRDRLAITLQSRPRRSSDLNNKGAPALVKFFETDGDVLYLYGPAGCGKSYSLEMLMREYGYEELKTSLPFDEDKVNALCARSFFLLNRKMVVIENGNALKATDIKELSKGIWQETKLVIVGETYPKKSPMRTHFKKQEFKFVPVKFSPFTEHDIIGCLSLYGLELGVSISYELLAKIAEYASGDMRAARSSLRSVVASESEDSVDVFLPFSDRAFQSEVAKLFSRNKIGIREAIDSLSPYVSMMIIRENIIKFCPEEKSLLGLLNTYANLDIDYSAELVNLAYEVGKYVKKYSTVYYRKPKIITPPIIDVDCSDGKKILYFRGLAKSLGEEE
jgi:hypothetical protein